VPFTIRKKLVMFFFFAALFLLVLAAFSIYHLKRLNTDTQKTLNDYQSVLIDTSGIVSNVLFHSLKIEQYIATGNPAHMRAVEDLKAETVKSLADLQQKKLDPAEVQWVGKIAEAYQTYIALSTELLDYYKKNPGDKESIQGKQIRILALLENTLLADSMSLYQLKKLKTTALIEDHHRLYHNYLWITGLAGLFFIFLVIVMGYSIIQAISNPIDKLVATTKELASGNLNARPPKHGTDEIGVLSQAFTSMADQLQHLFITLERKVEERTRELSEEQKFVSAVLETTHALVVVFDPQGKIVRFNKACREITGYTLREMKNKPVWEVLMLPEHAEMYRIQIEKLKNNDLSDAHENYWITKKGAHRLIAWFHTGLRDPQGALVHVVATGADITERRKIEQELFNIQKLESVGVLAGGIAHDFNNLLTSIHGEIELAQMNMTKGTRTYFNLAQAIGSCNRARDLIWQFITISKGGAPNKTEGSLPALIKETCENVFADSKIRYQVLYTEDLWPVMFDRSQLEQVIYNLAINAKEAMNDEGPVRIWLENVIIHDEKPNYILKSGSYIRMVIQDEGRGIPEKHLPLLFDPYFSTKERGTQKGMGLGLTTAYSIIKKHDGHIDLVSKVGVGTTFYIYLPANQTKP